MIRNGYIAGVTNPVFEEQTSWWDICVNLNTFKLQISPNLIKKFIQDENPKTDGIPNGNYGTIEDEELIQNVILDN